MKGLSVEPGEQERGHVATGDPLVGRGGERLEPAPVHAGRGGDRAQRQRPLPAAGHLGLLERHEEWAKAVDDFAARRFKTS